MQPPRDKVELPDITREEWVCYEWFDVPAVGDQHRILVRGLERTPEGVARAEREWERFEMNWRKVLHATNQRSLRR